MKRNIKKIAALLLALALVMSMAACGNDAPASNAPAADPGTSDTPAANTGDTAGDVANDPKVHLRYAASKAATHAKSILAQEFFDNVNAKTGGSVEIEGFWSSSLVAVASAWAETMAGATDIVVTTPGNEKDHFVVDNSQYFFTISADSYADQVAVTKEFFEATPEYQAEYEDLVPVVFESSGGELYFVTKEPVRTLADLKDKQIRVVDDISWAIVENCGGMPVKMPLSEVFDAFNKGLIDGVLIGVYNVYSSQFDEVAGYITNTHIQAPVNMQQFMRADAYNSMTDAQKAAFDECVAEYQQAIVEDGAACEQIGLDYAAEKGMEIIEFSDADLAQLRSALDEDIQAKVAELNAAGYPGDEMYARAQEILAKYAG